jgi:putative FmdB family regulatory protein
MPIYEYACKECGAEMEVFQKISDPDPESCSACGAAETLTRLVSRSSFRLKGGGWYSDLYSSVPKDGGSKGGASGSGGSGDGGSGGGGSSKKDSDAA